MLHVHVNNNGDFFFQQKMFTCSASSFCIKLRTFGFKGKPTSHISQLSQYSSLYSSFWVKRRAKYPLFFTVCTSPKFFRIHFHIQYILYTNNSDCKVS